MRRALSLARRGTFTHPNPRVGAVIVRSDAAVGEGWHDGVGTPHAETVALARAGEAARGATLYVTLEPCSHRRRADGSPRVPCTNRVIDAGIARVVCAMEDPDTQVAGQGFARLRDAGVAVVVGVCEAEARALNHPYIKHRTTGLPYILHKAAMTLDGKTATAAGSSRWISGEESRAYVHRALRATVDAVVVGIGTVLADDPSLTTRLTAKSAKRNAHQPLRVIVDSTLRTPPSAQVAAPGTVIYTTVYTTDQGAERAAALTDTGAVVIALPAGADGRVEVEAAMRDLAGRGALNILLEAGAELAAAFYAAHLVDAALFFVAPKLAGGRDAPTPIGGDGLARDMSRAYRTGAISVRRFGRDVALFADIVYDKQ